MNLHGPYNAPIRGFRDMLLPIPYRDYKVIAVDHLPDLQTATVNGVSKTRHKTMYAYCQWLHDTFDDVHYEVRVHDRLLYVKSNIY
jgi:hypothetical protein